MVAFKISTILEIVLIASNIYFWRHQESGQSNKHQITNVKNVVWNLSLHTKPIEILFFIQHRMCFQAVIVPILVNGKINIYWFVHYSMTLWSQPHM